MRGNLLVQYFQHEKLSPRYQTCHFPLPAPARKSFTEDRKTNSNETFPSRIGLSQASSHLISAVHSIKVDQTSRDFTSNTGVGQSIFDHVNANMFMDFFIVKDR